MKLSIKIAFVVIPLLMSAKAFCQGDESSTFNKLTDLLLPAPNATAMIKYGEASVNKNTGTPNISIPLFTIKGTKLSTSVSLGYSSSGIRVDEIASRAGMGWSLNAGGVITRTVRGLDDILSVRHTPYAPVDLNFSTWSYMYRICQDADNNGGGYDSEPDLFNFSFDGYSGSFVLDSLMNIVQVSQQALRIEKNFAGGNSWHFKITTPEGIAYLFGGDSAVETTKRTSSCARTYGAYTPTAWYLKQIVHPSGEVINFTYAPIEYEYDNGVSQTMYKMHYMISCEAEILTPTCTNLTKTKGVLLNAIHLPGKASIGLFYTTRLDCNDRLLHTVYYKDPLTVTGSYELSYSEMYSSAIYNNEYRPNNNKTPYLIGIKEKPASGTDEKNHYFSYIDPSGRPSRLSFSQDHWGYFNGKLNASLTPKLPSYSDQVYFPAAVAHREPDIAYAQKGMLRKIVYPTGGSTMLFYESNTFHTGSVTYTNNHTLNCDVTGIGDWTENSRERSVQFTATTNIKLIINCIANGPINLPYSNHVKGSFEVISLDNNSTVFSREFVPGYYAEEFIYSNGGNYKIVLKAYGTLATTQISMGYSTGNNTSVIVEKPVGGVRVARIATATPEGQPMIKKYYYGPMNDLNTSSLFYVQQPQYRGMIVKTISCNGTPYNALYETLNSYSLLNLGVFNNNPTSYAAVTESVGDNFEGGGIESRFYTGIDVVGNLLWNKPINEAPLSNFSSLQNARPQSETIIKRMHNGQLKPIKKTAYTYSIDYASEKRVYGYAVNRSSPETGIVDTTCSLTVPSCSFFLNRVIGKYNMMRYHVLSNRINPETTIDTTWDENGQNPLVKITNSFYANPLHNQLTKTETTNSKGETTRTTLTYPHDYNSAPYPAMVSYNQVGSVVDVKSDLITAGNTEVPVAEIKTNYTQLSTGHFAPASIEKSTKGNAFETEGNIELYDDKGHVLQYKGKDEIVSCYIWGYNNQYPVAKVTGASYAQATAQLTVSLSSLQSMDGQPLRDELNHIRTGLNSAIVITYTYKHLTGISSITDPNKKTNYYEYDPFSRLVNIKDQDGNTVKKVEYSFTIPDPSAGITVYYNLPTSEYMTCTSCMPGFTAFGQTYTVPAGRYYSFISANDAAAKASTDIGLYGQEWVNRMSNCYNIDCTCDPSLCGGVNKKCVNGVCETGVQVITSVHQNKYTGLWTCTYHYVWSDSSVSPDYTLVSQQPCVITEY